MEFLTQMGACVVVSIGQVLWDLPEAEGKQKYGQDFVNIDHFVKIHAEQAGAKVRYDTTLYACGLMCMHPRDPDSSIEELRRIDFVNIDHFVKIHAEQAGAKICRPRDDPSSLRPCVRRGESESRRSEEDSKRDDSPTATAKRDGMGSGSRGLGPQHS
jgi:hypothetical protein